MKTLTVRPAVQKEIVPLLANGFSFKEIANKTGYTPTTIETFVLRIRKEHGAKNSPHLVHIFHTKNLL